MSHSSSDPHVGRLVNGLFVMYSLTCRQVSLELSTGPYLVLVSPEYAGSLRITRAARCLSVGLNVAMRLNQPGQPSEPAMRILWREDPIIFRDNLGLTITNALHIGHMSKHVSFSEFM